MQLEAREVSVSYGRRRVLDDVSFVITSGQRVALTGPSGSGKSTLLGVVAGLIQPATGRMLYDNGRQVRPEVAWVLQTANLMPRRSAVDNVALGAYSRSLTRGEAITLGLDSLAKVGLSGLADTLVRHLSGGERQRLVVARALLSSHDFLLADEPTAQLDRTNADRVADVLLGGEMSDGSTIVVATHDDRVAKKCEQILRLENGKLFRV